jgi:glucose/arabinose dehydrogenase
MFTSLFARLVALIGSIVILWRWIGNAAPSQAVGAQPSIPAPRPQGSLPTLKMPTAKGWAAGHVPSAAPGLTVSAFATGLKHPRWMEVLPNGDVAVSEARFEPGGPPSSVFDFAMQSTMRRAAALGDSPNRITLLRDRDGDGVAQERFMFLEKQQQPFGMALKDGTFYVGNADGLLAFDYAHGDTKLERNKHKEASIIYRSIFCE